MRNLAHTKLSYFFVGLIALEFALATIAFYTIEQKSTNTASISINKPSAQKWQAKDLESMYAINYYLFNHF